MEAKEFKGQTVIIAKDQPQYKPLPAKITINQEEGSKEIETHWELSDDELIDIARSRTLVITQYLPVNQLYNPIRLDVENPCGEIIENGEAPPLQAGYVRIYGMESAEGFDEIHLESALFQVAKKLYSEHPGEDGYYDFTKFLWVQFADNREDVRIDSIIPYSFTK